MDLHFFLRKRSVRFYPLVFFLLVAMLLLSPDTLGKTAHAQGMSARVATATASTPGIWETNEVFVNTLYEQGLGREPDAAGYAGWVSALESVGTSHLSSAQYVAMSVFSTEYAARNRTNTQYVDDLYNAVLQRSPDAAGEAGWIANLNNGGSRSDVLHSFTESPEFSSDANRLVGATKFTVPAAGPFPFMYTIPAGQSIKSAVTLTPGGQTYYDPSDGANDACPSSLSSTDGKTVVDNNVDTDDGTSPDGTGSCTYSLAASTDVQCPNGTVLSQDEINQGTTDLTNAGVSSGDITAYQNDPCSVLTDSAVIIDNGTVIAGPPQGDFRPLKDYSTGNTIGYCGHINTSYYIQSHLFGNARLASIQLSQYVCSQGQDLTDGGGGKPVEPDVAITPSILGNLYGLSVVTQSHLEIGSNGSAKGLWVIDLRVSIAPINPFSGKSTRVFEQFFYLDINKVPNCVNGC